MKIGKTTKVTGGLLALMLATALGAKNPEKVSQAVDPVLTVLDFVL